MLERVHEYILSELSHSARTDTIFVVTAVLFNLVVLGINAAVAAARSRSADVVLAVLIVMTVLINGLAIVALLLGRQTRARLLNGLVAMYRDNQVDKYYDMSLLASYGRRYLLFAGIILCLALTAIVVPLVSRLVGY
ncbi:MAG: hypothetical protein HY331_04355 [Chloroflexi bacterium]|nr:hypothetical protein [Chloroflexota bacterium]